LNGKQTRNFSFIHCNLLANGFFLTKGFSILLISLLFSLSSYASSSTSLYESSIKVEADKSENELIAAAFTHVLIKVSGRSDISHSSAYKSMLKSAKGAISQFRYDYKIIQTPDVSEGDAAQNKDSLEKDSLNKEKWFWVRFNSNTIDNLLKEAQLPVWGKVRPSTLIWLSQEIKGQRSLLSQHEAPAIYDVIKHQAEYRGISLTFPFLDLQDQASVSATDIWGNFNDAILLASRRYQAQTTVTVRLFKEPSGLWVSQWNLLMLGEVKSWEIRDEKKARILASGVDELANKLAQQFSRAVSDGNDSTLLLQVNNVTNFKAFQALDDYLLNLATVKSTALAQMEQDKVIYNITYLGDKNALIQEIRLSDFLKSVERTRVDYGNADEVNQDYKPVILDDLGKSATAQGELTPEGKASAEGSDGKDGNKSSVPQDPALSTPAANPPEKKVEELVPELEYWLSE